MSSGQGVTSAHTRTAHTHGAPSAHLPFPPVPPPCRYSAADYRDRLYREIARRKKDVRETRDKLRADASAGATGGDTGGAGSVAYGHASPASPVGAMPTKTAKVGV